MEFGKDLKVVIFDFDGTLFHLDADWQALGKALGTIDTSETMGEALQRHRDEGNHARIAAATAIELAAVGERRLDPVIAKSLDRLSKKYQLAIFTRNSRKTVQKALAGTRLEEKLYVIGREDTRHLKPHPEGLEVICDHFSVLVEQAILVGDTDHDVVVAHTFGMQAVIVNNPHLTHRPTEADTYVGSIADLANRLLKSQ
jgi:HAD superfamily hydrolase (TIGR01549 family)